jgi:hypothetical protein
MKLIQWFKDYSAILAFIALTILAIATFGYTAARDHAEFEEGCTKLGGTTVSNGRELTCLR